MWYYVVVKSSFKYSRDECESTGYAMIQLCIPLVLYLHINKICNKIILGIIIIFTVPSYIEGLANVNGE